MKLKLKMQSRQSTKSLGLFVCYHDVIRNSELKVYVGRLAFLKAFTHISQLSSPEQMELAQV